MGMVLSLDIFPSLFSPPLPAPAERCTLSPIVAAIPWAMEAIVQMPQGVADFIVDMPQHQHFLKALHAYEMQLLGFHSKEHGRNFLWLIGIEVEYMQSNTVNPTVLAVHSKLSSAASIYDYHKICAHVCALRLFEELGLHSKCLKCTSPSLLLLELCLPKVAGEKDTLHGLEKMDDWPKVMLEFCRLVRAAKDDHLTDVIGSGSGFLSLLCMRQRNQQKWGYVTIEDNFLQVAIHVYLMRMVEFPDGMLPDYPDDLKSPKWRIYADQHSGEHFIPDMSEVATYLCELYGSGHEIHLATAMCKSALALEVESLLMEGLIRLSDGNISPYSVLSNLVDKLPWAAIETASNNEEHRLFNFVQGSPSPPSVSPALSPCSNPLTTICPGNASDANGKVDAIQHGRTNLDVNPLPNSTVMSVVMGDPPILAISDQTLNVTSEVVPSVPPDSSSTTAVDALLRKDAVGVLKQQLALQGRLCLTYYPLFHQQMVALSPHRPADMNVGAADVDMDTMPNDDTEPESLMESSESESESESASDSDDPTYKAKPPWNCSPPAKQMNKDTDLNEKQPNAQADDSKKPNQRPRPPRPNKSQDKNKPLRPGKRARSPSSKSHINTNSDAGIVDVDTLPGNSMDNPIDVKKEDISIGTNAVPPRIPCGYSFVGYDANGNEVPFTPTSHYKIYNECIKQFLDKITENYVDGKPRHLLGPSHSIIQIIEYDNFIAMDPSALQEIMGRKHIVIMGIPHDKNVKFDETAM
ncbi:hypothetical protein CPB84DRAFT_1748137 [Gymnopilus junonius]|uniref:Uncharacterized protein n=1 Tax=Gymnopilus junonius TaxID=109634 RepID=A0A9P5NNW4_GYMJU|nr:hypothetical protein CPB84DRAFT_1748137 [Gymnopilus junonius]